MVLVNGIGISTVIRRSSPLVARAAMVVSGYTPGWGHSLRMSVGLIYMQRTGCGRSYRLMCRLSSGRKCGSSVGLELVGEHVGVRPSKVSVDMAPVLLVRLLLNQL